MTEVAARADHPGILDAPERRIEGESKVTGRARYAADMRRDGMLHGAILRSPYAHARIASIDVSAARALPGIRAVVTGADVRPARLGRNIQDWPVLAWERVRFVGDRVAAVAADTREQADEALARIEVDYEELPAVFDPDSAVAADAPILHPDAAEERVLRDRPKTPHPNVHGYARHEHGDVDAGFASAARVFEHVFDVPRVFQGYIEPRASLVWLEGDVVRVVTTNKAPFSLRDQMAATLGIPKDRIVVDAGFIGGDFGGKGLSPDEYVLYFLARASGRPVRLVNRYADDLRATNTRHAARIRLRTGVDARGRILAHDARVVFDGGAYAAGKPVATVLPGEALATLVGYRVPAARVEALSVYTNTVPAGHMRAPGQPQNTFASESHVDLIAREMGIDPLEMRMRNAIRTGDTDIHGHEWHASAVPEVLETLRREIGPETPRGPGRGRGIALGARGTGRGKASVRLTVMPDASVEILTGISDQGGGAHTMMQRVAAAELGLAPERIRVRRGSTDQVPVDPGVGGSRVTPVVGGATLVGARALRERLEQLAPGASAEERLRRAAAAGDVSVVGEQDLAAQGHSSYAYAVDVEVDRETGALRIREVILVADVGTVINPVALRGQLVGAFAFGLGQALFEEMRVEDGVVVNPNLGDYKLPTIADVPAVRIVLLTGDKGPGPFGAKSVGELTNPGIAPAIANAVHDAAGVRVTSLPITAEKVFSLVATDAPRA
jgi:CO/xanthine dehydrogenase Mo-binding subunit